VQQTVHGGVTFIKLEKVLPYSTKMDLYPGTEFLQARCSSKNVLQ